MSEPLRVLVVDDDDDDVLLTTENLAEATRGTCRFDRARTGQEALDALARGAYDVCLLDYRLGPESGLDVLRQARAASCDVPVVMLTGAGAHEIDVAASDAGADDYLDKCRLDPEILERAIRYARSHRRGVQQLRAQNKELARLDREKNLLLGMAAHDLRNPIGAVLANVEFVLMEMGAIEPAEVVSMLERVQRSSRQMLTLIDELLDLSAVAAGTLELRLAPVDVVAIAREVVATYHRVAAAKGITLEVSAEPLPEVDLDRGRFEQVLQNLIGNAIKYSHQGTRVHVRLWREGDALHVAVEDHGIGMAAEFLPRLFRPFQKGQRAGTSGERSTGLGLSIVQRIVEAHGGSIAAASRLGEGSTFTVTLPFSRRAVL